MVLPYKLKTIKILEQTNNNSFRQEEKFYLFFLFYFFLPSFSKPLTVNNKVILSGNMNPDWKMKNYCSPMLFNFNLNCFFAEVYTPLYSIEVYTVMVGMV